MRRRPPRAVADRQPDYMERFDATTLFYDVFDDGEGCIVLSGPPLLNLHDEISLSFAVDGVSAFAELKDADRTQRSRVFARGESLVIRGTVDTEVTVGRSYRDLFRGHRVLFTLQKDNDLEWIIDWAAFHVLHHQVDALLIYDNNSSAYTSLELEMALHKLGLPAVIVRWTCRYGPGGGRKGIWDSDFGQISQLEHARFRFLADAELVINADVDELLLTDDRRPILDHLREYGNGALVYCGRWIEAVNRPAKRRHAHYHYYDSTIKPAATKWSAQPASIPREAYWGRHAFVGWSARQTDRVLHRHFRAITTNWKDHRTKTVRSLVDVTIDEDLEHAFLAAKASRFDFISAVAQHQSPDRYTPLRTIVKAARSANRWEDVRQMLEPALTDPEQEWPLDAYLDLGLALTRLERHSEAIAVYALAQQRWPEDGRPWCGGAYAAARCGRWEQAVDLWRICFARFSEAEHVAWWWASYADALGHLSRWQDASDAYACLRQRWPEEVSGWRGGAMAQSKLGAFDEAADLWQACTERAKNQQAWWWSSWGEALSRTRRHLEAASVFAAMRERWPSSTAGWRGGAFAAQRLEDWEAAASLWRGHLTRTREDEQDAQSWYFLAYNLTRSGMAGEAENAYRIAATRWPQDANCLRGYFGAVAKRSGWAAAAQAWDALGAPPTKNEAARTEIVGMLRRAGRAAEADSIALAVWPPRSVSQ